MMAPVKEVVITSRRTGISLGSIGMPWAMNEQKTVDEEFAKVAIGSLE